MPRTAPLQIAIIGSGPSGCYLAQSLTRSLPDAHITIIDRLASPFGLIRYGVAADHQHTKAISRQFERLFQSENVRFAGNIEVGRDISLEDLRTHFHVVALATGLSADRGLELPGATLDGVVGSGSLTRVLNAHPNEQTSFPHLGDDVVIIGGGNVALDVLRFLVKGSADYDASDISDDALERYLDSPAARVTMVSRSRAPESKGDPLMFRELATLPRAQYSSPDSLDARGDLDRTQSARITALQELTGHERPAHPGPCVTLRFGLDPLQIMGDTHVEAVKFRSGEDTITIPATSVITAVGFAPATSDALATLLSESAETGRLEPGLYRTGWAKRGPRGAIPENRACAKAVADEITTDLPLANLTATTATLGFEGLPTEVRERSISFTQWLKLDAHERHLAEGDRVRRKLPDHDHMVDIARG